MTATLAHAAGRLLAPPGLLWIPLLTGAKLSHIVEHWRQAGALDQLLVSLMPRGLLPKHAQTYLLEAAASRSPSIPACLECARRRSEMWRRKRAKVIEPADGALRGILRRQRCSAEQLGNCAHWQEKASRGGRQRCETVFRVESMRGVVLGVHEYCPGPDLGRMDESALKGIHEQVLSNAPTAAGQVHSQTAEECTGDLPVLREFLLEWSRKRFAGHGKRR